jgi:hypothetical protein
MNTPELEVTCMNEPFRQFVTRSSARQSCGDSAWSGGSSRSQELAPGRVLAVDVLR